MRNKQNNYFTSSFLFVVITFMDEGIPAIVKRDFNFIYHYGIRYFNRFWNPHHNRCFFFKFLNYYFIL